MNDGVDSRQPTLSEAMGVSFDFGFYPGVGRIWRRSYNHHGWSGLNKRVGQF